MNGIRLMTLREFIPGCERSGKSVTLLEWARRAGVPEESGGAYAIRSLDSGRGKDACEDLNKPYLCLESPQMSSPAFPAIELKRGNAVHETIHIVTRKMTRCVDSSYGMMVSSDASG